MSDPSKPQRARRGQLLLLLVVAVVAWQAAQAMALGVVGIPGVHVIRVTSSPPPKIVQNPSTKSPELGKAWRKVDDTVPPKSEKPMEPPKPEEPKSVSTIPAPEIIKGWIRAQAREFVGGVDAEGIPLYRFDIWLEMPDDVKKQAKSVAYVFDAPSAQPPEQSSKDSKNGFRVKFGGAACAKSLAVTVTFADEQMRKVIVDGCEIVN